MSKVWYVAAVRVIFACLVLITGLLGADGKGVANGDTASQKNQSPSANDSANHPPTAPMGISENHNSNKNGPKEECDSCTKEELRISERQLRYNWWQNFFTGWGVFFGLLTGAGAIVATVLTAYWGQKQWKASHTQTRQELRAYVFVERGNNEDMIRDYGRFPENPMATIPFKNYGKTPAYNAVFLADVKILKSLPADAVESLIERSDIAHKGKSIIPPGGSASAIGYVRFSTYEIFESFKTAWNKENVSVFIYGVAIFTDAFGQGWRSDFKYEYSIKTDPITQERTMGVFVSEDGNTEMTYPKFSETRTSTA